MCILLDSIMADVKDRTNPIQIKRAVATRSKYIQESLFIAFKRTYNCVKVWKKKCLICDNKELL